MNVSTNYDSEFCGSLPIHQINTIQSYGALLVVDREEFVLVQVSENCSALFDADLPLIVGRSLDMILQPAELEQLRQFIDDNATNRIPVSWEINGSSHEVLLHFMEHYILVEIDLASVNNESESFVQVFQGLRYTISKINAAKTVQEVCDIAAQEIKSLSGFDKVMIYRFDPEWNGTVVSEVMEDGMESFLNFTFPASDIPRQARDLYLKSPYRFIPDRLYKPAKLYPVINPLSHSFLDLSDCNLRGVAGVHLEYMKNMGIQASMSTRILRDDTLWGLIACHHKTAKHIDFHLATLFELLSGVISTRIGHLLNKEEKDFVASIQDQYRKLVEHIFNSEDLRTGVVNEQSSILRLLQAHGAVLYRNQKITHYGTTPPAGFIEDLVLWLQTKDFKGVFHTDSLFKMYDKAIPFKDLASGLLTIPIDSHNGFILLFRPEFVRVINWGGNPDERIVFDPDEKNYHPRNSFRQWQQIVEGVSTPWKEEEVRIAENLRSFIYEFSPS